MEQLKLIQRATKLVVGHIYEIKELTFTMRWVKGKYSHMEDNYAVFDLYPNDEYYRIDLLNCIPALYEITDITAQSQQLTLEQAAEAYAKMIYPGKESYHHAAYISFKDGAEWQKEQYKAILKDLLPILNEAFSVCHNEGQEDVVERAEAFLELLQD